MRAVAPAFGQRSDWDARLSQSQGNAFDVVRLVLATLVVLEHSYFLIDGSVRRDPLYLLSGGQTNFGHFAVAIFFVLSGFLVTQSLINSGGVGYYLMKRVARIVPGFLVASAFGCLVVGPLTASDRLRFFDEQNWRAIAATALALKQVNVTGVLDGNALTLVHGTLWTIKYEFDCYLVLALLAAFGLLQSGAVRAVIFLTLGGALAAAAVAGLPKIDHGVMALLISSPDQWPGLFPFFLAGSAFYFWRCWIPKSPLLFAGAGVLLAAALVTGGAGLTLLVCGTYAALFIALSIKGELIVAGRRADLSYGIYLYGWPLQQLLLYAFGTQLGPLGLFVSAMAAAVVVAWLSWVFVERPCLTLAKSMCRSQPEGVSA